MGNKGKLMRLLSEGLNISASLWR